MYLISLYFDDTTNKKIQRYIDIVAERTGNRFMTDGKVPPHMTISAFETRDEKKVQELLRGKFVDLPQGEITWCSIGTFLPYVIYLSPVLNEYLSKLSKEIYDTLSGMDSVEISKFYQPFQWFPHATIGKKLTKEEMKIAFDVLQDNYGMFGSKVTHIGLAKPNPHRDLICMELKNEKQGGK